jgi:hypothetical protein
MFTHGGASDDWPYGAAWPPQRYRAYGLPTPEVEQDGGHLAGGLGRVQRLQLSAALVAKQLLAVDDPQREQ